MNVKIGKFIALLRKEKCLTQEQLAEKLGVSNRSVSRWENGYTMPDIALMQCICEEFNITILELLNGERQVSEADKPDGENKAEIRLKKVIYLIIELMQNEKKEKSRELNYYLVLGFFSWGIIVLQSLLLSLGVIQEFFLTRLQMIVFILLGIIFEIGGVYYNCKIKEFTKEEVNILMQDENKIQMKSGEEMFQFAKKHQKQAFKQHKRAFDEISRKLMEEEAVIFTIFAEEYNINNQSGPWHVGVAVTEERFFVCGETMRGRFFTDYDMDIFQREEIEFVSLENRCVVVGTARGRLVLKGENLESVYEKLKEVLVRKL